MTNNFQNQLSRLNLNQENFNDYRNGNTTKETNNCRLKELKSLQIIRHSIESFRPLIVQSRLRYSRVFDDFSREKYRWLHQEEKKRERERTTADGNPICRTKRGMGRPSSFLADFLVKKRDEGRSGGLADTGKHRLGRRLARGRNVRVTTPTRRRRTILAFSPLFLFCWFGARLRVIRNR